VLVLERVLVALVDDDVDVLSQRIAHRNRLIEALDLLRAASEHKIRRSPSAGASTGTGTCTR
jgi:hypothetical protein